MHILGLNDNIDPYVTRLLSESALATAVARSFSCMSGGNHGSKAPPDTSTSTNFTAKTLPLRLPSPHQPITFRPQVDDEENDKSESTTATTTTTTATTTSESEKENGDDTVAMTAAVETDDEKIVPTDVGDALMALVSFVETTSTFGCISRCYFTGTSCFQGKS